MKHTKVVIVGVAVAVLVLTVIAAPYFYDKKVMPSQAGNPSAVGTPDVTIVRTSEGYEPKEVSVKKGDIVLWRNETDEYHWPASDLHPTHAIYSEFDPLTPVGPSEEWAFEFTEVGEWRYHDHIRANKVGTVTVVE